MSKKIIITLLVFIAIVGVTGFYAYKHYYTYTYKDDVQSVFDYYAIEVPKQIGDDKNSTDEHTLAWTKEQMHSMHILNLIAEQNIEGLKNTPADELNKPFHIRVSGDYFKNTYGGRRAFSEIYTFNALPLVIYHSALDKTDKDKEKTIAMLQVLFDKKLNPLQNLGIVSFIKDNPKDTRSLPYTGEPSLLDFAKVYSFDSAIELLKQYTREFESEHKSAPPLKFLSGPGEI